MEPEMLEVIKKLTEVLDSMTLENKGAAESNKSELPKMLDFCMTMMEAKDRKFHEVVQELKNEMEKEIAAVKMVHNDEMKEMKMLIEKTRENDFKELIEKLSKDQTLMQSQLRRLELQMNENGNEKSSSSADLKLEKDLLENVPDLKEMPNENKLIREEESCIIPVSQLNNVDLLNDFLTDPPDYVWQIKNINHMLHNINKGICSSEHFPLNEYSLGGLAKLKMLYNGRFSLYLFLTNPDKSSGIFKLGQYPRVFMVLKDQSGNEERNDVIRTVCKKFQAKKNKYLSYSFIFLSSKLKDPVYNVQDSVSFAFYVENPLKTRKCHSHNGVVMGKVDNYQARKKFEERGLLFYQLSPYFYTSADGLRIQVCLYLDGYGSYKGQGLSMAISFQNGACDALYRAYFFRHRTSVTVFNPSNPEKNVKVSVEKEDIESSFYAVNVCSHDVLESLLEHQIFCYKVVVEEM